MQIYAAPLDLARYITGDPDATIDQAPADSLKQIQSASILVRRATAHAYYDADRTTGLPTEALIIQAFNDATCAQAAAYSALGLDIPAGAAALSPVVASKSLGSASVSYATGQGRDEAKTLIATGRYLVSEAAAILRNANLLPAAVSGDSRSTDAWASGPWPVS